MNSVEQFTKDAESFWKVFFPGKSIEVVLEKNYRKSLDVLPNDNDWGLIAAELQSEFPNCAKIYDKFIEEKTNIAMNDALDINDRLDAVDVLGNLKIYRADDHKSRDALYKIIMSTQAAEENLDRAQKKVLDILRTFDESLNVIVEIFGAEGLRKCIANGVSFSAAINTKALIDKKAKKGDKMCQEIIDRGGIDFVIIATKAGGGMKKIVEATKVGFSLDDIISRPFLISNLKK